MFAVKTTKVFDASIRRECHAFRSSCTKITSLLWQVVRLLLDKRADIEAKEKFVSLESQRSSGTANRHMAGVTQNSKLT